MGRSLEAILIVFVLLLAFDFVDTYVKQLFFESTTQSCQEKECECAADNTTCPSCTCIEKNCTTESVDFDFTKCPTCENDRVTLHLADPVTFESLMDTTIVWVVVLGLVVGLMGCCVLYALRQVSVLRENVSSATQQIDQIRGEVAKSQVSLKESIEEQQRLAQEGKVDQRELLTRMKSIEHHINSHEKLIVDIVHDQNQEKPTIKPSTLERDDENASLIPSARQSEDVLAVYEEILRSVRANVAQDQPSPSQHQQSGHLKPPVPLQQSPQNSFADHRSSHVIDISPMASRGLSCVVPQPFVVHERVAKGNLTNVTYRKRIHSIEVGARGDDVGFVFSAANESARLVIPSSEITAIHIVTDIFPFDQSECITVTIHMKTARDTTVVHHQPSFTRRDPYSGIESGKESQYVFCAPVSQAADDWVSFVNEQFGHKVSLGPTA